MLYLIFVQSITLNKHLFGERPSILPILLFGRSFNFVQISKVHFVST